MSAIWALLHPDAAPVEPAHLERMSAALKPLGPERADVWRDGPVGLGHRLMPFTPEDRFEQQPVISSDGRLVLVFDGRLDNRPELADALKLKPAAARLWPDSAYTLRAFQTWGDDTPQYLVGGLACIIWDRPRRRLFAAISPSNSSALFYHRSSQALALASLPQGLLALPWVPRRLNEARLAGFLGGGHVEDRTTTFFEGIHRLPAGHVLAVEGGSLDIRPFWTPDPSRELRLPRDDDYVEAFNSLFERVVGDYLRSDTPVAAMMSSGLDSTTVAAVAALQLKSHNADLLTFTSVPDRRASDPIPSGRYANETQGVQAVAALYDHLKPEFIATDGLCFLDDLDAHFDHNHAPLRTLTNRIWLDAILRAAHQAGRRVILTGELGNRTISWPGHHLVAHYLRRGRLGLAWSEARALSAPPRSYPLWRALLFHGLLPLLPDSAWDVLHRLRPPADLPTPSPLRPAYAAAHGLPISAMALSAMGRQHPGGVRLARYTPDHHVTGWRSQFGVDARDPTADQRVLEFCLSLPHDQFQRGGQSRWLLRRAMAGRLPPEVLNNPRRGMQGSDWLFRFRARRDDARATLAAVRADALARDMLDLERFENLLDSWPDPGSDERLIEEYRSAQNGLSAGRFILWAHARP